MKQTAPSLFGRRSYKVLRMPRDGEPSRRISLAEALRIATNILPDRPALVPPGPAPAPLTGRQKQVREYRARFYLANQVAILSRRRLVRAGLLGAPVWTRMLPDGNNEQQIEELELAATAGAPSPPRLFGAPGGGAP